MNKVKFVVVLVFSFLIAGNVFGQHTGYVFVDANWNGILDKGERRLEGVSVSDGLHVVKSDKSGFFSLPGHQRERFVTITTPSGYKTENDYYRRIEKKNAVFYFGVHPHQGSLAKNGSHRFMHISDTEIKDVNGNDDWVNNLKNYASNQKVDFIIHTGDICYEKGLQSHIRLMNTTNMDVPVYYCIGNHDLVKGNYGEELFESLYGPAFYSFDAGNTHYIVTPILSGDNRPEYTKEDVYRWLKNDLAQIKSGTPIIIFNHSLLTTGDDFIYGINDSEQINLNEHNLKAWIYGHLHFNQVKKQGDVYSVCTSTPIRGGIDHSTSSFRMMHVDGKGNFKSELRYTYVNKRVQITSVSNGLPFVTESGDVPVSVNAYDANSSVRLVSCTYTVNQKMNGKKIELPKQSDWNWKTTLPLSGCKPGDRVVVYAKALFENGEEVQALASFVYPPKSEQRVLPGKEWTNLLGNAAHSGVVGDTLHTPLRPAWTQSIGAMTYMTAPIVYQGNVFVASVDENNQGKAAVHAMDAKTGTLRWKYTVRNSIKNTIVADKGLVFAQDTEGFLYALDANSGDLVWKKKLQVSPLPLIEGLVTKDGIVFAGTGKGFCAIRAENGTVLWTNNSWDNGYGATSTPSLSDNILVMGTQWGVLYGNDASTGQLLWKHTQNGLRNRGASPSFYNGLLYLISNQSFFIIEPKSGRIVVRKELPFSVDVTSTPLLTDKFILFGTAREGLVALDNETLEIKWKFRTDETLVYTAPYISNPASTIEASPVLSGKTVYVGGADGTLYGIDSESGEMAWKHKTGAPVLASVAISGNSLFAVDFAGNVYCFTSSK
ncbi:MAG: PQQ-binding-like beta-propeller repeat protein [Macellibacteroides fermentans]|uniref:outer membrane protein assembly factor BamB family protein n=1 Tax=Macellibacteroides fermentans TaxID=879969 RepID=UPI003AD2DE61